MYNESKHKTIVLRIKSFVWWHCRCRRRHGRYRGQRGLKTTLCFAYESRDALKSFLFVTVETITKLKVEQSYKFVIEINRITRRGSRSPDNAELGHFTFLFCRGR